MEGRLRMTKKGEIQIEEPTLVISVVVKLTDLVEAAYLCGAKDDWYDRTWSNIGRLCIEEKASMSPKKFTLEEALVFARANGFSLRQLRKRGRGIRRGIEGCDDLGQGVHEVDLETKQKINEMMDRADKEGEA